MGKTEVAVGFGLVDVEAKRDTTAAASDKQSFIDPQDLALEGVYPPKAATLETNYWKLDGSFQPFPDNPENTSWGIWSEQVSGVGGVFSNPIVMTLTFTNLHESKGLTFEFNPHGNDYANRLNIKWYNGATVLSNVDFTPDNWRYSCMQKVVNYNKIVITFYSMNKAGRFLKIQNIQHGASHFFQWNEIQNATVLEEVDLTSAELSINTLDFAVRSGDDSFNIFNPSGVYNLLQKKQQMSVEGARDGTTQRFGTFYLKEWSEENGLMEMNAVDAIGIMDGTTFAGGIYTNARADTLVNEILNDAGFGYSISTSLVAKTLTGWIPRCSHREALQQVSFALGAYVDTSRCGMVRICEQPSGVVENQISRNRKIVGTDVSLREYVTGAAVTEHQYTLDTESGELYKAELTVGEHEILFSEPAASLSCTGGTLTYKGVNHCVVKVTTAGEVIVNGTRYVDNTTIKTVNLPEIEAGEKENVLEITDATLINAKNSQEIAEQLLAYHQNRIQQTVSFVLGEETVGDMVTVEVMKNMWRNAVLEKLEIDLTGGWIAKVVVVGE